jgi:hypothetical protein
MLNSLMLPVPVLLQSAQSIPRTDSSFSSNGSVPLVGLDLLNGSVESLRVEVQDCENTPPPANDVATPTNSKPIEFVPSSTIRARKRAQFDQLRKHREMQRREEDKMRRQSLIKQRKAEVNDLRTYL